jgi:hypothetical protein
VKVKDFAISLIDFLTGSNAAMACVISRAALEDAERPRLHVAPCQAVLEAR